MSIEEIEELTVLLFENGYDMLKTINESNKKVKAKDKEIKILKEKVDYYENRTHQLDYELNNMVDNYLQFAKDNGATPEIKEFTRYEEDYFCKNKPVYEEIYVPAFIFWRYKGSEK